MQKTAMFHAMFHETKLKHNLKHTKKNVMQNEKNTNTKKDLTPRQLAAIEKGKQRKAEKKLAAEKAAAEKAAAEKAAAEKAAAEKAAAEKAAAEKAAAEKIPDNQTGKGLEKKKEQSKLTKAKIEANNDYKTKIHTIGFILSQIKESDKAKVYVSELASKYKCIITFDELMATDKADICKHITEDEQTKRNANPERYTFWYVLTLISRHYKATK